MSNAILLNAKHLQSLQDGLQEVENGLRLV